MTLYSKRLQLRQVLICDVEKIHQLHARLETDKFNTLGIPATIQITESIVGGWLVDNSLGRAFTFCIENTESKEFIGLIALNPGKEIFRTAEVWYKIHVEYWNQGYTTEALLRLLEFGFVELKLHRIEAGCAVENIASSKVLEKAGMIKEGRKRKKLPVRGTWLDTYFYSILEEDFL